MLVKESTFPMQQVGNFWKFLPQEAYGSSWYQKVQDGIEQTHDSSTGTKGNRHGYRLECL